MKENISNLYKVMFFHYCRIYLALNSDNDEISSATLAFSYLQLMWLLSVQFTLLALYGTYDKGAMIFVAIVIWAISFLVTRKIKPTLKKWLKEFKNGYKKESLKLSLRDNLIFKTFIISFLILCGAMSLLVLRVK